LRHTWIDDTENVKYYRAHKRARENSRESRDFTRSPIVRHRPLKTQQRNNIVPTRAARNIIAAVEKEKKREGEKEQINPAEEIRSIWGSSYRYRARLRRFAYSPGRVNYSHR